ncbi:MAG: hypothetical protein KDA45_05465 [Planctomycetales bacterium]|nr:hypothetical protein [Planctomycetales bacterium]
MTVASIMPRSATWETLQKSRNVAAVATLATGLSSTNAELRRACLKTLLARKELESRRAIVLQWEHYDPEDCELLRGHASLFVESVRGLLRRGTLSEKRRALAVAAALEMSEVFDDLLEIVVDAKHGLQAKATSCLLSLCQRWGERARAGRDVPTARTKILDQLHDQLVRFHEHRNMHLIDAWLCVVHWDDALQRGLIRDSRHAAYRSVIQRLRESEHPAALQLLGGYLLRATTPKNVINILIERRDIALAVETAKLLDETSLGNALRRLQQLPALQCLQQLEGELPPMDGECERRIWLMVAASSSDWEQVLRAAVRYSKLGTREARQTAAEMLSCGRRPELEVLVPAIQSAAAAGAMESPCLGGMILQIADWLQSPSIKLKKAAREFLQDFTVDNLLDQIRHWPTQMCKAMARIVVLVEPDATQRLTRELQSPAPRRRLAALQAVQLLDCAEGVSKALMPLLEDPRLEVRVRTIDLLGALGHEALEEMIPRLLEDASTDIQDAASRAVRRMRRKARS